MNFLTNEINVNLTGATDYLLSVEIKPKAEYITQPYTITIKDGSTVLNLTNVTGNRTLNYNGSSVKNLKAYVTSNLELFMIVKQRITHIITVVFCQVSFILPNINCHSLNLRDMEFR
jgi:hypothetical protein